MQNIEINKTDKKKRLCLLNTNLISHNIFILNKRTSIRLEKEMWIALKEIAYREFCSIHDLCTVISQHKKTFKPLTSAVRTFIVTYFREAATLEGHKNAGHGKGSIVAIDLMNKDDETPYRGLRYFMLFQDK